MNWPALLLLVIPLVLLRAAVAGPRLFFGEADVAALRELCHSEPHRDVWQDVLRRAERYVDPDSPFFADPAAVLASVRGLRGMDYYLKAGRWLAVWGETLGPACYITGEDRFGEHGAELLLAMTRAMPLEGSGIAEVEALARGEMMRGLAIAYDYFGAFLDDDQRQEVEDAAAAYVRHALAEAEDAWWVPYSNWLGVTIGGAGLLAVSLQEAFPEESPPWIARCTELVTAWFDQSFDIGGAYIEGASYVDYGMANVVLFADALARTGGPELYQHPHIRKLPMFIAMSLVPGTTMTEARNTAGYAAHFAVPWALRMAKVNDDGLAKRLWQQRQPRADFPFVQLRHSDTAGRSFFRILWASDVELADLEQAGLPLTFHFPGRGLVIWRTGWDASDVMFSIEAGFYRAASHRQSDQGHFNLYGLGEMWAIDPGPGNEAQPESRSQGRFHSLVQIDGKSQALSGAGRGVDGKVLVYDESDAHCYVLLDVTEAYIRNVAGHLERQRIPDKPPDPLAAVVRHARRHALYVRPSHGAPPYFVILDDIVKDDQVREFAWQMIAEETMQVSHAASAIVLRARDADGASSPRLMLFVDALDPIEWREGVHEFDDGRHPRRVRNVQAMSRSADPQFIAVLIPLPAAAEAPQVAFERREQQRIVRVRWPGRTDTIAWPAAARQPLLRIESE